MPVLRRCSSTGLVEETRQLLGKYPQLSGATPFTSLGYKQATAYLAGELTLAQAVALTQQGHRNYAKRQMTWFRREPDVTWLAGFGDDDAVAAERDCSRSGERLGARHVVKLTLPGTNRRNYAYL